MVLEIFAPKPLEAYHQSRGPDGPWKFGIQTKDSTGGTGSTIQVQFQWTHFDIALRQLPWKNYLGERCLKPLYCRNLMPQAYFCLAPRYLKIAGPKPRKSAVYIEVPKISVKARTAATTEFLGPVTARTALLRFLAQWNQKLLPLLKFLAKQSWTRKNESAALFLLTKKPGQKKMKVSVFFA